MDGNTKYISFSLFGNGFPPAYKGFYTYYFAGPAGFTGDGRNCNRSNDGSQYNTEDALYEKFKKDNPDAGTVLESKNVTGCKNPFPNEYISCGCGESISIIPIEISVIWC